jgi:hypothetical protein
MVRNARYFVPVLFVMCLAGCKVSDLTPPKDPEKRNEWIAKNKSTIEDVVRTAAEFGTEKGLKQWAKKNPAGAKEAAIALSKNISTDLLPYFKDGQKLLTAAEVQQLLASSLFNKVEPVVKAAIVAASAVLDYYLPIPSSTTYLTQDQKDIVCAFLEGVQEGCNDYSPTVAKKLPAGSWIE